MSREVVSSLPAAWAFWRFASSIAPTASEIALTLAPYSPLISSLAWTWAKLLAKSNTWVPVAFTGSSLAAMSSIETAVSGSAVSRVVARVSWKVFMVATNCSRSDACRSRSSSAAAPVTSPRCFSTSSDTREPNWKFRTAPPRASPASAIRPEP